jgi:hypothetical protein
MKRNPLIIGISGLCGSGKDTVKCMIELYYNYKPKTFDEFINLYNKFSENKLNKNYDVTAAVAFADKLKEICSVMYGIDLNIFYDREVKNNMYINIKTHALINYSPEIAKSIISADYYYNNIDTLYSDDKDYHISIRELMVYVGTYLVRFNVGDEFFIRVVNNFINKNYDKDAIIVSDVRFDNEFDFIKRKHGVTILVKNNRVSKLQNIAENLTDDQSLDFDYEISNNGSIYDLLSAVYNLLTTNIIYKNIQLDAFNVMLRCSGYFNGKEVYEVLNDIEDINGVDYGDYACIDYDKQIYCDFINYLSVNSAEIAPCMKLGNDFIVHKIYEYDGRYYIIRK